MDGMDLSATGAPAWMGVHTLGRTLPDFWEYDGFWASWFASGLGPQYHGNMFAVDAC